MEILLGNRSGDVNLLKIGPTRPRYPQKPTAISVLVLYLTRYEAKSLKPFLQIKKSVQLNMPKLMSWFALKSRTVMHHAQVVAENYIPFFPLEVKTHTSIG